MVMATNMAIGGRVDVVPGPLVARDRGDVRLDVLPFLVLLVPFWAGAITADALMTWGHVLMLPAMAAVLLLKSDEYSH